MGTTKIIADISRNVIKAEYIRTVQASEDASPVDLTVKLLHQFITPQNTLKEIELKEFEISSEFLTNSTGLPGTTEIQQISSIFIANPRYITDLFLEISEVRELVPVITKVSVLDGVDTDFPAELPEQPYKDPEHESNQPETLPDRNISTPEIIPFVYTLEKDGTAFIQASKRIYLDKDEFGDDLFRSQVYDERVGRFFIENSITNLLPNPSFTAGATTPNTPDKYEVDGPGLILTTKLTEGDIPDTNILSLRVSNINPFNAFDTVTVKTTERSPLLPGLNALTGSVYYIINSDFKNTPFSELAIKFNFYNSAGDLIATESDTKPVAAEGCVWEILYGTVQGSQVPFTAVEFDFEIEVPGIGATDPFELKLYLPQVESLPYFTTRTLDDRVQDTYETSIPVDLSPDVYMAVKTAAHIIGPGTRGLVSTTTALKDGFHFLASSERLRLKAFDVNGVCIFNLASVIFTVAEGEETEYGVFIDGDNVEFFLNGVSLSTHVQTYALNQTGVRPRMGSLESSNTTINTELLDWKILSAKPS